MSKWKSPYGYSGSQRLAQMTSGAGWTMDLSWGLGEGYTLNKPGSFGYYFSRNWSVDANGRASSQSGYGYGYNSSGSIQSYFTPPNDNLRWSGDRLAARSQGTDRRWEYRYNARGEIQTAWQQTGTAVTAPADGETLAGTGSSYAYDAIGNRTGYTEAGQATSTANNDLNTGVVSSTVTLQDPLPHTYTSNAANQYTQITHPAAFDVRGTRTAGATIAVNGVNVATPTPTAVSGYQTGGTGTIFRARVTNTAPSGTSTPDLYEPVKVTQNGTPLTVDDPIQYIAKPIETLTYDADGNLKTDGRWTYTWDAADRLIKMESPSFYQPAVVPVSPATSPASALVNVPAKVIEFAYDGLSRRIRKKVTEGTSFIAVWEAYVYDGWNMVLSVKLNPAVGASQGRPQSAIASYVWRPDMGSLPFARRNWQAAGGVRGLVMANYFTGANGGGIHLPVMDAMGNVTQVVRAGVQLNYNGDSMRSEFVYDYDAFGKETRSSTLVAGLNPDSFPFHFSTKFTDPESGFNYYGYRFYDPANGRWLNRDPIGERGGLNLYGMTGNDAVCKSDLLGLKSCNELVEDVTKPCGKKGGRPLNDREKGLLVDLCKSSKTFKSMLENYGELARLDRNFVPGITAYDTQADFDAAHPGAAGKPGVADLNGISVVSTENGAGTFMGTFVHEMYHNFQNAAYVAGSEQGQFKPGVSAEIQNLMRPNQNPADRPYGNSAGSLESQAQRVVRTVRNEAANSGGFLTPTRPLPDSSDTYIDQFGKHPIPRIAPKSPIKP